MRNVACRPSLILLLISLLLIFLMTGGCGAPRDRTGTTVSGNDASPDALPEIAGSYVVNGIDPLGAEYSGVLTVSPGGTAGEYRFEWIVTGSVQEGIGVLKGNQLDVSWRTVAAQRTQSQGSAHYTITTLGELRGERTVDGYAGTGREAAFPN